MSDEWRYVEGMNEEGIIIFKPHHEYNSPWRQQRVVMYARDGIALAIPSWSRDQVDLPFRGIPRGDFNETIATREGRPSSGGFRGISTPTRRRWRRRLNTRTVACRGQACTQFVSSSDNYAIMPTFLPSSLVPSAPSCKDHANPSTFVALATLRFVLSSSLIFEHKASCPLSIFFSVALLKSFTWLFVFVYGRLGARYLN